MLTPEALCRYLQLYIGCETNRGRFIGLHHTTLLIEETKGTMSEYHVAQIGKQLCLHLKKLEDLTEQESKELIEKGFAIGRPNGYSFSNEAFIYLLTLHVDLFGLINYGYAMQIK